MAADRLRTSWVKAGLVEASAPLMVIALGAIVHLIGLRSFSKMSSFNFEATVALGSNDPVDPSISSCENSDDAHGQATIA